MPGGMAKPRSRTWGSSCLVCRNTWRRQTGVRRGRDRVKRGVKGVRRGNRGVMGVRRGRERGNGGKEG